MCVVFDYLKLNLNVIVLLLGFFIFSIRVVMVLGVMLVCRFLLLFRYLDGCRWCIVMWWFWVLVSIRLIIGYGWVKGVLLCSVVLIINVLCMFGCVFMLCVIKCNWLMLGISGKW